jgi:hypothetical protein
MGITKNWRVGSLMNHLIMTVINGSHHHQIFWQPPTEYSVVSIKRTGCNKRTGLSKIFFKHEKKNRVVQNYFLVHEKKVQGGKKLQNS